MPGKNRVTEKQKLILKTKQDHPHFSNRQIAKVCETGNGYVSTILQAYQINYKSLQDYKENKADILEGISNRLLSSITTEDIQKATIQQRVVSAGILMDKANDAKGLSKVTPMVVINQIRVDKSGNVQVEGNTVNDQIIDVNSVVELPQLDSPPCK